MRTMCTPYTVYSGDNSTDTRTQFSPSYTGAFKLARTECKNLTGGNAKVQIEQGSHVVATWSEQGGKILRVEPGHAWMA